MNVKRITPVLFVKEIEPVLPFWVDALGFAKAIEVPHGEEMIVGGNPFQHRFSSGFCKSVDAPARLGCLTPENLEPRAFGIFLC